MRILITGATGFIGGALARALLAQGHTLVCAVRHPQALDLGGGAWSGLQADLATVPSAQWWHAHLQGIDAVVNAVGILRESRGQRFDDLHHRAPAELFRACAEAGVKAVVQVSALGADAQAQSHYHLSKRAADDVLRSLPLRGAIVQPSVVYGAQGSSAAMFDPMAAAPLLALPQAGRMAVQPVHVDDVVAGVLALLVDPPRMATIAFVGPEPLTMTGFLRRLRAALGIALPLPVLPLHTALFMLGARMAGHVPGSMLDADTAGMLLRGNAASAAAFEQLLGRPPRPVERFIAPDAVAAQRRRALRAVWLPVLWAALAASVAAVIVAAVVLRG